MNTPDGFGYVLILIFAGLVLFLVFLVFKRRSSGFFGNRLLAPAAAICLIIVFLFIRQPIVNFYQGIFKEAPYSFSEFRSIVFKYGERDSMLNRYNSASGEYQYLNKKDSLIKVHIYLTQNDLLYLYRKATEDGFWDFPANEINNDTVNMNGVKPPRYTIQFNYSRGSKKVTFDTDYDGPKKLVEANQQFIVEIQRVLTEAEERQKKIAGL